MLVNGVKVFVDEESFSAQEVEYFVDLAESRLTEAETLTELEISTEGDDEKVCLTSRGTFEKFERFVRPSYFRGRTSKKSPY